MSQEEYAVLLREIKGLQFDLAQHRHHVVEAASIGTMPGMLAECSRMEHRLNDIREQCEGHRPVAGAPF